MDNPPPACFYDQFLPAVIELSTKQTEEAVDDKMSELYSLAWKYAWDRLNYGKT